MKTIVLTAAAARDLDNLPDAARRQVSDGLIEYATTGRGDVKRLSGRDGYRMRIGSYRVIFDGDQTTILAVYIGKRETTTYRRN
jgi:mRNA interferase RelE/StbE